MSMGGRSYSDQSYGAHKTITIGGLSAQTQTLATNGIYASHQFMYPARLLSARVRVLGNGAVAGSAFIDLTRSTEFQLFRSTDSGTGLEAVLGTADGLGATGSWDPTVADSNGFDFDNLTATNFNVGDYVYFTAEGEWDEAINLMVDMEVIEKFVESDS